MNTIFKYPLKIRDEVMVEMPRGAVPLSVHAQGEQLCLWALVNTRLDTSPRRFRIIGTGHPIDEAEIGRLTFIGTVLQGPFVWHVWEKRS